VTIGGEPMKDCEARLPMIELTRLNGNKLFVNCDAIKYLEAAPDTTLTLTTGEKILVAESCDAVVELSVEHRARVLRSAWPDASMFLSGNPPESAEAASGQPRTQHPFNS
jgi:flagellar protein FlbD